jgi:hypothetical protein
MFSKGYKSYKAAKLLLKEGFWQDALVITRTVLELGYQARWLNFELENRARLFIQHELRDRRKLLNAFKISASADTQEKAAAAFRELDDLVEQIIGSNKSQRNWWGADSSVEKLAQETDLSSYNLHYRPLSWFVHSSPVAVAYYLDEDGSEVTFHCDPADPVEKDEETAQWLFHSLPLGLRDVMELADSAYDLKLQPEFDQIQVKLEMENAAKKPYSD